MSDTSADAMTVILNPLPIENQQFLDTLISDFLQDLDAARRSPHTIKNYRSDLSRFRKFVAGEVRFADQGIGNGCYSH